MKTYDKIFALGHDENKSIFEDDDDLIEITEKVDGANFRFEVLDGKIHFGSRTQPLVEGQINKNFRKAVAYVTSKIDELSSEEKKELEGKIFFCENMVKHTISYNWDITPPVIGYDVFDGKYIHDAKSYFEKLGIEFVPIVKVCSVKECKELIKNLDELVPTSKYITMKAEGIVFKNYSKQLFGKYVRAEFKEKNDEVFGKNKKRANNDEEWMTAVYCNNYKIEKVILKLLDEGDKLSMELMHKLPTRVYEDIFEENWREIIKLDKTVNFRKLKSMISKRCLEVLKVFMTNTLLNQEVKKDEMPTL